MVSSLPNGERRHFLQMRFDLRNFDLNPSFFYAFDRESLLGIAIKLSNRIINQSKFFKWVGFWDLKSFDSKNFEFYRKVSL